MAQVNPGEAAFEGFRLIRREPVQLVFWGLAAVVFYFALMGVMKGTGYFELMSRFASGEGGNPMQALGSVFGTVGLMFAIELVFFAVIACAAYRSVLRPQETGFGRFRFGGDEMRMIGLFLIMAGLLLLACFVLAIVLGILLAVVGGGRGAGAVGAAAPLMVILVYLFMAAFCVQFSMAAPQTFAERRLAIFRSWRLVKGNYWRLFGCFVLTFVLVLLLGVILFVLQVLLSTAVGAPNPMAAFAHPGQMPDMSSRFTPIGLAAGAVAAFIGGMIYPIWFAPQAAAYRDIVGVTGERAAELFS